MSATSKDWEGWIVPLSVGSILSSGHTYCHKPYEGTDHTGRRDDSDRELESARAEVSSAGHLAITRLARGQWQTNIWLTNDINTSAWAGPLLLTASNLSWIENRSPGMKEHHWKCVWQGNLHIAGAAWQNRWHEMRITWWTENVPGARIVISWGSCYRVGNIIPISQIQNLKLTDTELYRKSSSWWPWIENPRPFDSSTNGLNSNIAWIMEINEHRKKVGCVCVCILFFLNWKSS